jgi:hypothetical protein
VQEAGDIASVIVDEWTERTAATQVRLWLADIFIDRPM